ncbi:MAG: alpha-L-rhamnosidase [Phycisphaerae bacterium]|nr:alpha-L-rhamnosidase [Phycisphaerae bacterium]
MIKQIKLGLLLLLLTTNMVFALSAPSGLMCELMANPQETTIQDSSPEFGWIVNSDVSGDMQQAYQVMLASSCSLLDQNKPDKWDSKKVASADSVNISYAGSALAVNRSYFWKVRIWNNANEPSDWSSIQEIKTGPSLNGYHTARYKQVSSEISPITIKKIQVDHYLIDFGKDAFGYLRWDIPQRLLSENLSGTTVEFHFGEKLKNGFVDRKPGGTIRYYQAKQSLDGSASYEIHPPGVTLGIAIPADFGRIAPFRYVELVNCPYPVTLGDFKQLSVHYPFDDNAASFVSDNIILNQIWQLCHYSIKPTSFCGVYVDGDRERKPYEADAYINQLCHYCVDREFTLARYSHEYLLEHPTWPTEWKQHSIMIAWADYLYTGNSESLAEHYDKLKNTKLLSQYARTSDGLLNTAKLRDIVDWPVTERDKYDFKPVNTVINAFYYHTLTLMEKIAIVLGKTEDARIFSQQARQVYQSYQSVFYDQSTGLYIDGQDSSHSSLHANMLPLAFGLVPEKNKAAVVDFVKSKKMACSVYAAQYLLEGLYLAGEEQAALDLIVSQDSRSWSNMIREGSTITMEAWGIAYKPNQDWNHAWGAAPANIIPRFIAGIRPVQAGFAKALIHPQPAALNHFQIKTPTIRGEITVTMDRKTDICTFKMNIPANMTARFVLPKNCESYTSITLDGKPVTLQKQGKMRFIDPLPSGDHTLIAQ